ncbi:HEAT repeat domain-containing protein [Natrialba swarupiae]|uniref:HEAT repeat domain-containing protein n=1 Tax=Natrialba swarupiae TaxID=2448032 RepID=A0A5D5AIF3_9EURY|nr:hypothetical protein [Natrialba swarupiae]TYT61506.1 hypothetical protein FYC77_13395 [Natrialba swarupiae]
MAEQNARTKELLDAVQDDPTAIDLELAEELLDAEGASGRATALQAISVIATEEPDRVLEYTDRVVELLDDDVLSVRSTAALALTSLARNRPDTVVPAVPSLVDILGEEPPLFRFRAAGALAPLTADHPDAFVEHTDHLFELLLDGPTFDDDPRAIAMSDELSAEEKQRTLSTLAGRSDEWKRARTRSNAAREVVANVLVEVARVGPEEIESRLDRILEMLSDDDAAVRGAGIEMIRHVAEDDPDAVEDAIDPLLALLDDVEFVRARTIRALGYAEAGPAIEPLREIASTDSNDDIADLAADTADWLGENS